MAPYDSDSDVDDDFTETDVLLGYPGKDAGNETISRLGGRPDWLTPEKPPSAALARCKICKSLMVLMLQLNGELPEKFPGHERRLYVFTCRKKSCRRQVGSIRTIRGVRISPGAAAAAASAAAENTASEQKNKSPAPAAAKPVSSTGLGEALFGVKPSAATSGAGPVNPFSSSGSSSQGAANPFATKSQASNAANPFSTKSQPPPEPKDPKASEQSSKQPTATGTDLPATFAEKLALNNPQAATTGPPPPPEPWPPEADQPAPYPVAWIAEADYETLDPTPLPKVPTTTAMDIDEPGSSSGGGGGGKEDKEVFESTMDSAFQKFADRVGQNPEQVIRYEFGGPPLLYSKDDVVGRALAPAGAGGEKVVTAGGMPRCANCGAGRVFEVQMTPHAITELESEEDGLDGMDWGTVIVGVCERDCQERGVSEGEAGYVEEWVGVQWEELTMKR